MVVSRLSPVQYRKDLRPSCGSTPTLRNGNVVQACSLFIPWRPPVSLGPEWQELKVEGIHRR